MCLERRGGGRGGARERAPGIWPFWDRSRRRAFTSSSFFFFKATGGAFNFVHGANTSSNPNTRGTKNASTRRRRRHAPDSPELGESHAAGADRGVALRHDRQGRGVRASVPPRTPYSRLLRFASDPRRIAKRTRPIIPWPISVTALGPARHPRLTGRLIRPIVRSRSRARRVREFQQHPTRAFHDFSSVRIRFKRRRLHRTRPSQPWTRKYRSPRRRHRTRSSSSDASSASTRARRTTTHRPRVTASASGAPHSHRAARPLERRRLSRELSSASRSREPGRQHVSRARTGSRRVDASTSRAPSSPSPSPSSPSSSSSSAFCGDYADADAHHREKFIHLIVAFTNGGWHARPS